MKICFSTLGCPDFEWTDVYSMAKDLGFDGIEIRSYGLPADPFRSKPFSAANLPKTVEKLQALRVIHVVGDLRADGVDVDLLAVEPVQHAHGLGDGGLAEVTADELPHTVQL